jgi:hypothetical protein
MSVEGRQCAAKAVPKNNIKAGFKYFLAIMSCYSLPLKAKDLFSF